MIYVFLAPGFEEIEAVTVIDILRRAELEVVTVGVPDRLIRGAHGISVIADISIREAVCDQLEMVILPGGMPGTLNLERSKEVCELVQYCINNEKMVSAICAAPSILGHLGLLEGKKATCFPGFEGELLGAQVQAVSVCKDGALITANGPGSAIEFALKIVESVCGNVQAEALKAGMQCR